MADDLLYGIKSYDEFPVNPEKYLWVDEGINLFKGIVDGVMPVCSCLDEVRFFHAVETLDLLNRDGADAFAHSHHKTRFMLAGEQLQYLVDTSRRYSRIS